MSRTDKTQPWRIKALFYPNWVDENHDHTKGYCDLPEQATVNNVGNWEGVTQRSRSCYWDYAHEFWCSGMARCGCPACNRDPYYEVPKRKRDRMAGRRYVRTGWRSEY